jgi:hypothetical protein
MGFGLMAWRYAAASAIGTSHNASGTDCQDAHAEGFLEGLGVLVGVVSDGAGSAARSKAGAECACEVALQTIAGADAGALFTKGLAAAVLERIRIRLQQRAEDEDAPLREFACTLLVAIVGNEQAAFWQIGDGAICFREKDAEQFGYAFWPEKGDYANVTFFVTDPGAESHLEFDVASRHIAELAMLTDGLERLALDFASGEAHTPFFSSLFPAVRALPEEGYSAHLSSQIQGFLSSERVNKRTDDDKTLLLASRAV